MTADNAIVLHIGPHKTGSTALQAALAAARPDLARAGIRYPGRDEAHHSAAWAVTGFTMGFGDEATRVPRRAWPAVVRQARRHRGRVIISSEFFARLPPPSVRRVVSDLGAERVHVLLAVRPLAELLPSTWQQYLKTGLATSYPDWLADVLTRDRPATTPGFWRRADFARMLRRWRTAVPARRITAVVLDPADRGLLFRATEQQLGLPEHWLDPFRGAGRTNRSMTAVEAELVRAVNELVRDRIGWGDYSTRIRHGAIRALVEDRRPDPDEPRLTTPTWALDLAAQRQRRDRRALRRSGIQVIGDPGILLRPHPGADPVAVDQVPVSAAALALAVAAGLRP